MRAKTAMIVFGLAAALAVGCSSTVHRELPPQSVSRTAELGTERLPLAVAVIGDPALTFDYPRYFRAFVEVLNPGLAETLQSAFRGDFQNVSVVEGEAAAGNADLFASPRLTLTDPMKLTVTFVDPRSRRVVAEYSSERSCDGNAPGVYAHLETDLLLFAAAVVFPPADGVLTHEIQKHNADRFNAAFAPAIAQMAGDIASKASNDPNLQSFASPSVASVPVGNLQ
jgi:hypothetical protein